LPGLRRLGRRAAATVEFALAAPLLATMVLGMIEMSRGINVKETLSDSARKACRKGCLPGNNNAAIIAEVNDILNDNNIDYTKATITILVNGQSVDASTAVQHDKISVKVAVPASAVFWAGTVFLSGSVVESETVVMMRQG
jgi:Flp pilus assembly protein TadG